VTADQNRSRFTGDERDEKTHRVLLHSADCVWLAVGQEPCHPSNPHWLACAACRADWKTCPDCYGTGVLLGELCPTCKGYSGV
jgi:hypothetical protein